jgi:hypothetical protein
MVHIRDQCVPYVKSIGYKFLSDLLLDPHRRHGLSKPTPLIDSFMVLLASGAMLRRLALFSLVLMACAGADVHEPVLTVTSQTTALSPGQTAQLLVTRQFPGGGPIENVTSKVHYAVSSRDTVSVSPGGLVTAGEEVGPAEIYVTDTKEYAVTAQIHFLVSPAIATPAAEAGVP